MTKDAPATESQPPDADERERARRLVQDVVHRWNRSLDLQGGARLRDRAGQAVAHGASERLRQVLTRLQAQLALCADEARALDRAEDPFLRRYADIQSSLRQATDVLEAFLEHVPPMHDLVHLDRRHFDLSEAMAARLNAGTAEEAAIPVRADLSPAPVEGDEFRLLDVLDDLHRWLQHSARPRDHVVLRINPDPPWVRGFFGLSSPRLRPKVLLDLISGDEAGAPGAAPIDGAYARAVVEQHGGALYVDRSPDGPFGFGFTLPLYTD